VEVRSKAMAEVRAFVFISECCARIARPAWMSTKAGANHPFRRRARIYQVEQELGFFQTLVLLSGRLGLPIQVKAQP
jgi:hypothetical protein